MAPAEHCLAGRPRHANCIKTVDPHHPPEMTVWQFIRRHLDGVVPPPDGNRYLVIAPLITPDKDGRCSTTGHLGQWLPIETRPTRALTKSTLL